MKTKEGSDHNPSFDAYREMVTEQKRAIQPKRPGTVVQSASTQKIMDRRAQGLSGVDWDAPLIDWKAKGIVLTDELRSIGWTEMDAQVGRRPLNEEQVKVVEDIRRKARNTTGQSEVSLLTPEKKEKAIHAFTYSEPAALTPSQILKAKETSINTISEWRETVDKKAVADAVEDKIKKETRRYWSVRLGFALLCVVGMLVYYYVGLRPEYHPGAIYNGKL